MDLLRPTTNMPEISSDSVRKFHSDNEYQEWFADLENRKSGDLNRADGIDCPLCRNKGRMFRWDRDMQEMFVETCGCMDARRSIRRLNKSNVCRDWQDKTFDRFHAEQEWQMVLKRRVQAYAADPAGRWLLITGQSGCGKTHLATAAFVKLVKGACLSAEYVRWADMVEKMDAVRFDAKAIENCKAKWIGCDLLYMDDLFKKRGNAAVSEREFDITLSLIDARYNDPNKLLIISTERSINELREMDEALAGRIHERCGKNIIQVKREKGRNYRMRTIAEI